MSLLHCPLCIGLAVLSIFRAACHLALAGLRLAPPPAIRLADLPQQVVL